MGFVRACIRARRARRPWGPARHGLGRGGGCGCVCRRTAHGTLRAASGRAGGVAPLAGHVPRLPSPRSPLVAATPGAGERCARERGERRLRRLRSRRGVCARCRRACAPLCLADAAAAATRGGIACASSLAPSRRGAHAPSLLFILRPLRDVMLRCCKQCWHQTRVAGTNNNNTPAAVTINFG